MINPFQDVDWNPGLREKRKFALSLIIGCPSVALLLFLLRRITSGQWHSSPAVWIAGIGAGMGLALWLLPVVAKPFYVAWYFLARCIGIVLANLLFMIFFFAIVTPVGLLRRTFGRDPLNKGLDRTVST